jgi:hypothetical protein
MYLEGDKWKNWHTRCSDAAIKENKSEEDTKLSTISVSKLLEYAHTALHHCEINNLDPDKVPVFLTLERDNNLYSNIGLGICCSSQLGTYVTLESSDYYKMFYVAPDSKPEVGEYWRSRGVGYDLSGFVVSKLAGERLTRLVKYVLNTDEPLSHLDYREFEPNWIQFKFQKEEFNLELLDKLARANDNIVNEAILRQCMINDSEKRQIYNFFDDGKCSPSRLYKAYIKKVIPFNKADIHLKIHLVNSALNCSWIWNGDTDYFIGCYIPEYDDHLIWFARTKYGTWFSMDIQSNWQGGLLDVNRDIQFSF